MNATVLLQPVITEKSLRLAATENKYTFLVERNAHKHQIHEAVEKVFDVDVVSVNTIKGHRVRKATGKKRMKTVVAPNKKAIVQLKKGQTSELFDFGGVEE